MESKKEPFPIYMPSELKNQLKSEAMEKGLSLNAYIIMLLMERRK